MRQSSRVQTINIFFFLRLIIAGIFLVSGFQKLISPYQNFLYVLQSYQLPLPSFIEDVLARTIPWIEFMTGIFILLGFWMRYSVILAFLFFTSFIAIVGQAIVRKLPIDKCGCFGDAVAVPLPVMLSLDVVFWLMTMIVFWKISEASVFSWDKSFEK